MSDTSQFCPECERLAGELDTATKNLATAAIKITALRAEVARLRQQAAVHFQSEAGDYEAQPEWIATNGEDLSGHDFGCEYVWVCYDRAEDPGWGRQLWKAGDEEDRPIWEFVTHYMPTDIRTPSPPDSQNGERNP